MPDFSYTYVKNEKIIHGSIIANSISEAKNKLQASGISARDIKESVSKKSILSFLNDLDNRSVINILTNVGELDKVGMPMIKIMEIMKNDLATNSKVKKFATICYDSVKAGDSLSDSFVKTGMIDQIYCNFVRIAENVGDYPGILSQTVEYVKWTDAISRSIRSIVIKSSFSLFFIFGLVMIISTQVIPKVMTFITETGMAIPWYTLALVLMSNFFVKNGLVIFLTFLALIIVPIFLIKSSYEIRHATHRALLKIPGIGKLIANVETARFVLFFSIMFEAGVNTDEIFHRNKSIMKNEYMKALMSELCDMIGNGSLPHDALKELNIFPSAITKMISIAFESGNIKNIMKNIKYFLDQDINADVDKVVSSIQPAMLLLTGILVGWMAIGVFGPIYGNIAKIGQDDGSSRSSKDD